jgi:hypothetical protein
MDNMTDARTSDALEVDGQSAGQFRLSYEDETTRQVTLSISNQEILDTQMAFFG